MKTTTGLQKRPHPATPISGQAVRNLLLGALILIGIQQPTQAQTPQYTKPSWWFGGAAGANFNFYRGTTQVLNSGFTAPAPFHNGMGVGLYAAPLVEYHHPDSRWGAMLQAGYDSRKGSFNPVTYYPCNCETDLTTRLTYITVEPSLRLAPFKSGFYVYAGPRLGINVQNSFTFKEMPNPEAPQTTKPQVTGDLSQMNALILSMQVGAGFDVPLWSQNEEIQGVLSPFVAFHPYFGQDPRAIESWTLSTLRVGAALKFGRGQRIPAPLGDLSVPEPEVKFSVHSPKNIPTERRVTETFPLRNYVFFNLGSTEIPERYVLLRKDQVKDFKEDQLEVWAPKSLSGRSARQMNVYYNVLNIVGDRLNKNPSATINLVGSSESGPDDGKAMAESVKKYLVDIFGIAPSRISVEGRDKPKIPSEQPGATEDLALLRQGDRRVSIESSSPALLMEFQSGSGAMMKPVQITAVQTAPLDSYVSFNVDGANEAFKSWSLEIKDKNGKIQYFGPYTKETVTIPGKTILGTTPEGDYQVTMIGQTRSGNVVRRVSNVHMVLWTPTAIEQGSRYSVIFEFDESDAIGIYEKYLAEVVAPKIPNGGTVIIHGYTDIIGDDAHNHTLSHARANEVKDILKNALAKAGRSDVKFEVYGFGEDESLSPFENRLPEERFYNRTVIIDIIPAK